MRRVSTMRWWLLGGSAILGSAGCKANDQGPSEHPLVLEKAIGKNGDSQSGPPGEELGNDLQVNVTRDGSPVARVSVAWSTGNGGSLLPSRSLSNDSGVAASRWTLGPTAGEQAATATVDGADGSPLTFTATATEPNPSAVTVQVLGPDGGNRFQPAAVTIIAGQQVTWNWPGGSLQHNVQPDTGTLPSSGATLSNGPHTYIAAFSTPGTYRYYCRNHGGAGGIGMSGTVTVTPNQP